MKDNKNIFFQFYLNNQKVSTLDDLFHVLKNLDSSHTTFIKEYFNDKSYVFAYTSGSTGKPKKIKIRKQHLLNSAHRTINFFNLSKGSKVLLNLSAEFIAGKMMWVRALAGGWHLDVISSSNDRIRHNLSTNFYDFGAMVPLQVYQNLKYIHRIKKIIIGGGEVSKELQQNLYNLPNQIYATYGMTETLTHIAIKPLNKIAEKDFYSDKKLLGTYRVLDGVHISSDNRNCLIIDAQGITNKPVVTNDLVKIIDDKHFIWLGRYDNVINSGTIKLIPEQIEKKIALIIKKPFFITGLPDKKLGEKLVLLIESKPFNLPDLSTVLSKYEIPKQIFFIDKFIRTETGKIKRKENRKIILKAKK